jgi:hypothetical protein
MVDPHLNLTILPQSGQPGLWLPRAALIPVNGALHNAVGIAPFRRRLVALFASGARERCDPGGDRIELVRLRRVGREHTVGGVGPHASRRGRSHCSGGAFAPSIN